MACQLIFNPEPSVAFLAVLLPFRFESSVPISMPSSFSRIFCEIEPIPLEIIIEFLFDSALPTYSISYEISVGGVLSGGGVVSGGVVVFGGWAMEKERELLLSLPSWLKLPAASEKALLATEIVA